MNVTCPHCQSADHVVKFGTFEGIQRYWCKVCKRKFTATDNLPKMKTPMNVIASAMSCYYSGMPLDAIQRHLNQQFEIYMSESGIYNWILRFSKEAVERTKDYKPDVGDVWVADETMLKINGKWHYFWDIIDSKTRYLLASYLTRSRTLKDAQTLMERASARAGKVPKVVITDKLSSYIDGIERAFGAASKHIQSKPFTQENSTNLIERFHGTLKARTKVIKAFKTLETARLITDAWLVHYNFFKEHESCGNEPPAQKIGKVPFKDWDELLDLVKVDMLGKSAPVKITVIEPSFKTHTEIELPPARKSPKPSTSSIIPKTQYKPRMTNPKPDMGMVSVKKGGQYYTTTSIGGTLISRKPIKGARVVRRRGRRRK